MDHENSARFLNAFAEIEDLLRDIINATRYVSFYQLIDKASLTDRSVRAYSVELKEYGDLRNAIVHERINGQPIAEPHPETVKRLEMICSILRTPPKVSDGFLSEVVICSPFDLVGKALAHFVRESFSQIPVFENGQFLGLLTAETVTHWVAARLAEGTGTIKEENVFTVMKYAEAKNNFAFVNVEATLFDVLSYFEKFNKKGKDLDAVLVTKSGLTSEIPVGIITVSDLPELYEAVGIKSVH